MKDILEKAAQIKLVVFDVDGVLTDGSLFVGGRIRSQFQTVIRNVKNVVKRNIFISAAALLAATPGRSPEPNGRDRASLGLRTSDGEEQNPLCDLYPQINRGRAGAGIQFAQRPA